MPIIALTTGLSISTYFSPDDDTQAAFLQFIQATQSHLRIAIYGLHLPPLIDDLIALHKRGADVALVCDSTQAAGKYEHPEILQLLDAGIPLLVGSSQKHAILHHKFAVRDKSSVLCGSWNFSLTASKEANYFHILESSQQADLFLSKWQELWAFIGTHEQNKQPKEG